MSNSDRVNVPASRQSLRMLFDSAMDGFAAEDEYRQQWQGDTGLSFPADRHELNVIAIRLGLDPQATHAAGELLELARAQAVAGPGLPRWSSTSGCQCPWEKLSGGQAQGQKK